MWLIVTACFYKILSTVTMKNKNKPYLCSLCTTLRLSTNYRSPRNKLLVFFYQAKHTRIA